MQEQMSKSYTRKGGKRRTLLARTRTHAREARLSSAGKADSLTSLGLLTMTRASSANDKGRPVSNRQLLLDTKE